MWKAPSWTVAVIRVHGTECTTASCSADTSPSFCQPPPRPDPAAHLWLTMCLSSHFGSAVALSWELSTCPEGYKQGGSSATNIKKKKKLFVFLCYFWSPRIPSQSFMKTLWFCPPKGKLRGFSRDRRPGSLCPGGQCAPAKLSALRPLSKSPVRGSRVWR